MSSTPPSDAEAVKFAQAFLESWSQQRLDGAASITDVPDAASQALREYANGLHLKKLSFLHILSAGPSTVTQGAIKVTFHATAQVAGGTWSYTSAVAV